MGTEGNRDPRSFWQADLDDAARRLVWLVRTHRPHVMTTYNDYGGYGHPDHIRVHDVSVRAFDRAGDPAWYPEQLAPEHGGTGPAAADGGLEPWAPLKLYEQAIPATVRQAMRDTLEAMGEKSFWSEPEGASAEEVAAWRDRMQKMLVPDESITAWIDVSGQVDQKWAATRRHVTQIADDHTFMRFGLDAWRTWWSREAFILRESRVPVVAPEADLFAGI
jgi:N-acetyl-1-D-myo-inositol-2-amino-2-deoxy-alpha-D-glucopyranoside deacetylase